MGSISFTGSYDEMRFVDSLVGSSIGASVGSSVKSSLGSTLGSPRFIGGSVRRVVDGIFNDGVICATLQQECAPARGVAT